MKIRKVDSSKMLFLLDPGHGIDTPGKRSPGKKTAGDFGIFEWEFNRDVVKRIEEIAWSRGVQAVDIVVQNESVPLRERVRRANEINETHRCAFISVHANASGKGWSMARGFRVFQRPSASEATSALSATIRHKMKDWIPEWRRHSASREANFFVLKKATMPAVLTENGFMTNRFDCEILMSSLGRDRIAKAHISAMMQYQQGD